MCNFRRYNAREKSHFNNNIKNKILRNKLSKKHKETKNTSKKHKDVNYPKIY